MVLVRLHFSKVRRTSEPTIADMWWINFTNMPLPWVNLKQPGQHEHTYSTPNQGAMATYL